MSDPVDYLSDEDAERMSRAAFPRRWSVLDALSSTSKNVIADSRSDQIAAMRRAWSARPASSRDLDSASMRRAGESHPFLTSVTCDDANLRRGHELRDGERAGREGVAQ